MSHIIDNKLQSHHVCVRPRVESGKKHAPYYCNFAMHRPVVREKKGKDMSLQSPVDPNAVDTFLGATGAMTYLLVLAVAILGGVVKFVKELNESIHSYSIRRMILKFFGNITVAAFAGLLAFWFSIVWGFGDPAKAIMVSLSGFLGGHAIDGFVGIYKIWIKSQQRTD